MAIFQIKEVLQRIWSLVHPLHGRYKAFIWLMVGYEAMQIVLSFTGSGIILLHQVGVTWQSWIALMVVYVLYEEIFLRLDQVVVWKLAIDLDGAAYRFMRENVLKQFFRLDPAWHDQHSSGQLVGKVNDGIEKLRRIVSTASWEIIPTTIQIVLSLIPLLLFSPGAAALTVIAFLAFAWITMAAYAQRLPKRKERHDLYELAYQQFDEDVESHRTVIAFGQDDRLLQEHVKVLDKAVTLNCDETRIMLRYDALRYRIISYLKHGIFMIWIWQLQTQRIDLATFVFLKVLLDKLIHSAWRFSSIFREVSEASESARRLDDLMQQVPELIDGTHSAPTTTASIELKDIWFDYGKDDTKLNGTIKGISLRIPSGSVTALVGRSGAGKSTLQRLIMRERDPQIGSILLNGISAKEWSLPDYRALFAEVPQGDRVYVYDTTIGANISFGKPDAMTEEIQQAARSAGIHDFIDKLPDQYNTMVGDRGLRLSGGQKQRVALARALLTDRPILVLDEATSSVDAETEAIILDGIRVAAKTKTVIVIAHRLSTIKDADTIVVLEDGQIVEQGSHDQLVRNREHYARQVELQSTAWEASPVLV
jgi:ABC-type multidrug transport system fused ATPase/permease subunit